MSEKETGFTTMAGAKAEAEAPHIGVGMLGYAFMGKAHSNGFKKIPYMMYPPPAVPELVAIAGRDEEAVAVGRARSIPEYAAGRHPYGVQHQADHHEGGA